MDATKKETQLHSAATRAVIAAIKYLEAQPFTNAGRGSNLTIDGHVECDAAIMESAPPHNHPSSNSQTTTTTTTTKLSFGAVTGLTKILHPIDAAACVMERQRKGPDSIGRVPPLFLAGKPADRFCARNGVEACESPLELVTAESRKRWEKALSLYSSSAVVVKTAKEGEIGLNTVDEGSNDNEDDEDTSAFNDTVCAVAIDDEGFMASGVSSGGILLKHSGRVGEAALFGSGLWISRCRATGSVCGAALTGCGEQIIATQLARQVVEHLLNASSKFPDAQQATDYDHDEDTQSDGSGGHDSSDIHTELRVCMESFLASDSLAQYTSRDAGVILIQAEANSRPEAMFAHTTDSMCVGWLSDTMDKPHVQLSRRAGGIEATTGFGG